ncbi:MAG TPA: IS21-like element helper ATPase IstB [Oligoflexia bacterium]|nr:IS21-like element helper ATPase IstB [Oligoflexia bacterium]
MTKEKTSGRADELLQSRLDFLKLPFIKEHYQEQAAAAGAQSLSHLAFLEKLMEGEALLKQDRCTERRIMQARFPLRKTLDEFDWSWPTSINRLQIQNQFRLQFIADKGNIIFISNTGLGKTHLSLALGYTACLKGYSVLFTTAVDAINNLVAAGKTGTRKHELHKYLRPALLILDELGYLALDKIAADLLFQIISARYERGSTIITTNLPYKKWATTLNNDATLTSALLDRLLHHSETVTVKGKSYRTQGEDESE